MTYKSAVDNWYYWLIVCIAVLISVSLFPSIKYTGFIGVISLIAFVSMGVGLFIWLLVSTHYTITEDLLIIKSGPLTWEVPRAEIKSIKPSRSILSAPALSLNRLEIKYGKWDSVLVSPKNREQFIEELSVDAAN